jgi:hypothetical protein
MDLARLQIAPAPQFLGDIGRNISRPSLSDVDADDAERRAYGTLPTMSEIAI